MSHFNRSYTPFCVRAFLALAWLLYISLGFGQNECVPPPAGLTNWWPGEGNAKDIIGGYHGGISNGTTFAAGYVGQAFSFNGSNQYVTNSVPALTNIVSSYTMEFWAKPTASRASTPESTTGTAGNTSQRYAIFPNNGKFGAAGAGVSVGTNGISVFEHASAYLPALLVYDIPITNWVHVAVVYSNQQPRLYLNGGLVRTGLVSTHASCPSTCLGENGLGYGYYAGLLDEVSIYDRALSAAEILAIYAADSAGKCAPAIPPEILFQPTNQTVFAGGTATFNVNVASSQPVAYQWQFNGTNLMNNTASILAITNVALVQAGDYRVIVTNIAGAVTSSVATLTVSCGGFGNVALYSGEGNADDSAGTNNGTSLGLVYAAGKVGQCFSFNGSTSRRLFVPDNPNFKLTNSFTLEGWLKIAGDGGVVFFRGDDRVGLDPITVSMGSSGFINFAITSESQNAVITAPITYNLWKHIAVSLEGSTGDMKFYVDGVLMAQTNTAVRPIGDLSPSSNPGFAIGNTSGTSYNFPFNGLIDEVGVYSRALDQGEIQSIYNTSSHATCVAPIILTQPTNQTAVVGNPTTIIVSAAGTPTLIYQWSFNGTNLPGATDSRLSFSSVQTNNAGTYSVQITNPIGMTNSTTALLTVVPPPPCIPAASNMISWWRAEGNADDEVSGNHGTLWNGVGFGPVRTGQGFIFNGNGTVIPLGNPTNLQIQDLTIEGWIRRGSASVASLNGNGNGHIFGYDNNGYGLYLSPAGLLSLSKVGTSAVSASSAITDTNLHHVAVTKAGSTVVFYIDGTAYPAGAYNPGFTFGGGAYIGGLLTNNSFLGSVDELAVFNRALAATEIQAIYSAATSGKCPAAGYPPFFISQPGNQTVLVGTNLTLAGLAAGSPQLAYQWYFQSHPLAGATAASLILSNIQPSQAGIYSVRVTNAAGFVLSTNATLTINYPVAVARVVSTNVTSGNPVTVPVTLVANGIENAMAFSVNYDSNRLFLTSVALGNGAPGALLQPNLAQTNLGRIGVSVIMPYGATFASGTQTVAQLTFATSLFTNTQVVVATTFGDQPTARQLLDLQPALLPMNYSNGTVTIAPVTAFEGDALPRPNGDRTNSLIDWFYVGRYVARLDNPTNAAEFQRADCAPRGTFGDGALKASDWVQAGRYSFGFDPQTPVGGPTNETASAAPASSGTRLLTATSAGLLPGQSAAASIVLAAQGNENALSFSATFDSSLVTFAGVSPGAGAAGAVLFVNTNQAAIGKLGFVLGLGAGGSFSPGNKELLRVNFLASTLNSGSFALAFGDAPVNREVADALGNALPVGFTAGAWTVTAPPTLRITRMEDSVLLGWPQWASNFVLQETTNDSLPSLGWTNLILTPGITNGENVVVLPATNTGRFYRLYQP